MTPKCGKGKYVYKTNIGFMIESTLIIRCTHSGYIVDVNQRTCKLVIKILRKTYSSLVKMIFERVNNFMQNKCTKWMKYRKALPNHKNASMGSSTVHLHGVDLIDMQLQD